MPASHIGARYLDVDSFPFCAGVVDIKLSDDNVARLEAASRPEDVTGPRYNEKVMAWVDR
jgi:hypothetical protein